MQVKLADLNRAGGLGHAHLHSARGCQARVEVATVEGHRLRCHVFDQIHYRCLPLMLGLLAALLLRCLLIPNGLSLLPRLRRRLSA